MSKMWILQILFLFLEIHISYITVTGVVYMTVVGGGLGFHQGEPAHIIRVTVGTKWGKGVVGMGEIWVNGHNRYYNNSHVIRISMIQF